MFRLFKKKSIAPHRTTRAGIRGKKLVAGRWVFDSSYYLKKDFANYGSKK